MSDDWTIRFTREYGSPFFENRVMVVSDARRIIVDGRRESLSLLRPIRPADETTSLARMSSADWFSYSPKDGSEVFFRSAYPSKIRAGYLRKTGRGLVLGRCRVLQVSVRKSLFPNNDIRDEMLQRYATLANMADVQTRFVELAVDIVMYLICKTDADVVVAKMVFPEAILY